MFFDESVISELEESFTALMDGLIIGLTIMFFIILICEIFKTLGMYKTFKKANQPGWKALIPIYNMYTQCLIIGIDTKWVLIYVIGAIVSPIIPGVGSLLYLAISIYYLIITNVSTAKSFGKGNGFAFGLWLLSPIFWMILGFSDKAKYIGATPVDDFVMNTLTGNNTGTNTNTNTLMCNNCGFKVSNDQLYCPKCGTKIEK